VKISLVDDTSHAVRARGEVRATREMPLPFDCSVAPDATLDGPDCNDSTFLIQPILNEGDAVEIRFKLADGSFTDWQPVPVILEKEVVPDFNGPGCSCTKLNGTAKPVTVPSVAQL